MSHKAGQNKLWKCPRCGTYTSDFPAISRRDNKTEICSACGLDEALFDFALSKKIELSREKRK